LLHFLADENFNHDIIRGVLRREPTIDIVTVQEVGLVATADSVILDWAARHRRLVLTHDVATMPGYAYQRVSAGLPMPGLVAVSESAPIGEVIEDMLLLADTSEDEWEGRVCFLPL
jgi:hypothetical protein